MSLWRTIPVFLLVLTLFVSGHAGTRIYQPLESVLRMHPGLAVVEARVVSSQFSQRESSDDMLWEVEQIKVHRLGDLKDVPGSELRFSAYRPPVTSGHKNRSPYSSGSSLEFSTEIGQTYLFLCLSPEYVIRVENVDRKNEIIEILEM
jgi:hypothetical protein